MPSNRRMDNKPHEVYSHTPHRTPPQSQRTSSHWRTVTKKPQQHDAEQLKKPDADKCNRDSIEKVENVLSRHLKSLSLR